MPVSRRLLCFYTNTDDSTPASKNQGGKEEIDVRKKGKTTNTPIVTVLMMLILERLSLLFHRMACGSQTVDSTCIAEAATSHIPWHDLIFVISRFTRISLGRKAWTWIGIPYAFHQRSSTNSRSSLLDARGRDSACAHPVHNVHKSVIGLIETVLHSLGIHYWQQSLSTCATRNKCTSPNIPFKKPWVLGRNRTFPGHSQQGVVQAQESPTA